jgi:hypothetical protein
MKSVNKIINWVGNIQVFKYPLFIVCGKTSYNIKGPDQRAILDILKPGDVLLRRYDSYISNVVITGYYKHAAIYVGDDKIIHVIGKGICMEDILTFMRCDDIAVLRCDDNDKVNRAIKRAYIQLAKEVEYDFKFDKDCPKKFYCTEFVDFCYDYPVRSMLSADSKYILPDDFLDSGDFKTVWDEKGNID